MKWFNSWANPAHSCIYRFSICTSLLENWGEVNYTECHRGSQENLDGTLEQESLDFYITRRWIVLLVFDMYTQCKNIPTSLKAEVLILVFPFQNLSTSGGRVKTWKRRWFILTDNCLYYFEYTTVSFCAVRLWSSNFKYLFKETTILNWLNYKWVIKYLMCGRFYWYGSALAKVKMAFGMLVFIINNIWV